MAQSKRERVLLITTVAVAMATLAFVQLEKTDIFAVLTQSANELKELRARDAECDRVLKQAKRIQQQFDEITGIYEVDKNLTPEKQFTQQVNQICKQNNFQSVQIDKHDVNDIENVDDYGLITLPVQTAGKWKNVLDLFIEFNKAGFMMEEVNIISPQDNPNLRLEFQIARPVKLSELKSTSRN